MKRVGARVGSDPELVAAVDVVTSGFWFGYDFYWVSPAMLAERESRTT